MSKIFARFRKDEKGVTAIEYGLMAALIAVGVIAGATALSNGFSGALTGLGGQMTNPGGGTTP
ncbi:Flp family type IVb pilin [Chelativorans sp. AA-79]|uniref:Flp family type IVb pilin n=1 Tax=Chelativorans sp. AA-79 TaxID=3028735 RepID=UPI0023F8FC61|nr:Flp family type IVb pilin [Chelativorans sp. AA-79]WEX09393.1 Flp family type IVb pilin [Chelativorans sp. AA-79]